MEPIIPDTNTDARMTALEQFLQRYLGPRRPEFGEPENELQSTEMPAPLRRFFRFAGRWPGHNPRTPYANRFCIQDTLGAIRKKEHAPALQLIDNLLVFVWENQGVWVAATKQTGADPPVWISENCSHRDAVREWRQLETPLSHFLVSFVLQELMFGSEILAWPTVHSRSLRKRGCLSNPCGTGANTRTTSIGPRISLPMSIFSFVVRWMKLMAMTGTDVTLPQAWNS
jgi:hypothetical protein